MFDHLDSFSEDGKIFWEEYETNVRTLSNISNLLLEKNDFKRIKIFDQGYFEKDQFIRWCVNEAKISVPARKDEVIKLFAAMKV